MPLWGDLADIKVGSTDVAKLYVGSSLQWERGGGVSRFDSATAYWVAADHDGMATTWVDRIGSKAFDLTIARAPIWNATAQAFEFVATTGHFLELANDGTFDIADDQDFQIEVGLESTVFDQTIAVIVGTRPGFASTQAGWSLRTADNGDFEVTMSDGSGNTFDNSLALPAGYSVAGGRRISNQLVTYVDGAVSPELDTSTRGAITTTRPLRVGASSSASGSNWGSWLIHYIAFWKGTTVDIP